MTEKSNKSRPSERIEPPLRRYREKRSAERTPEPFGTGPLRAGPRGSGMFVVQKHAARALHYDFRLEMEGVLRSWAIPKGPSMNPADKRLAVMVEDHPIEYGDFEGAIPEGNYGAGSVIVWDRGQYSILDPPGGDAAQAVRDGKLDLEIRGYKLRGAFTLVRTRYAPRGGGSGKQQWLLIKKRDPFANDEGVTEKHPRSVLSGLTIEEMADSSALAQSILAEVAQLRAPRIAKGPSFDAFPLTLAKVANDPFDGDQWLFEIKYDGVRALAIRTASGADRSHTRIFGRSGIEITARYPEVALAFDALPFDQFVIDGEIVALGDDGRPSFQLLQRRMHLNDAREARRLSLSLPVFDFVFDLLGLDGFDLRGVELETRKALLARLVRGEGPLRYSDHIVAHGRDFYAAAAEAKLEGILAKRRKSPYAGKRTGDWLKIKCPVTGRFVVGGYTDPEGARSHFGALLVGQYDDDGALRFVTRVGTGFSDATLRDLAAKMRSRARPTSPFRRPRAGEVALPRRVHFCEPELVCDVRYAEMTDEGGLRHPSFVGLVEGVDPRECRFEGRARAIESAPIAQPDDGTGGDSPTADDPPPSGRLPNARSFTVTHPDKVFWPAEGYTKADLVAYYLAIAPWMLPYLKDRPVMMVRYPDGIGGKNFYQKDAPGFAPEWIRTEKIYSEDSKREIAYFVIESAEALGYVANLGTIPIHIWSSRIGHLERPDWLLFDLDPKGSTTEKAVGVARELAVVLRKLGLRPYCKTSGQMGLHVVVGLRLEYTYEQARSFSELVARLLVSRVPELATIDRNVASRKGRVYVDYLQLGHGKTIAAPFAVRPIPGAPVSAPIEIDQLTPDLDPLAFNIKTMPGRMKRLGRDPFAGALNDPQSLELALPALERELARTD